MVSGRSTCIRIFVYNNVISGYLWYDMCSDLNRNACLIGRGEVRIKSYSRPTLRISGRTYYTVRKSEKYRL